MIVGLPFQPLLAGLAGLAPPQDTRVGGPLWFEVRRGSFERIEDVVAAAGSGQA